jgi:hypothetical protein
VKKSGLKPDATFYTELQTAQDRNAGNITADDSTATGTPVANPRVMVDLDATNVMRIAREATLEQFLPLKVAGIVFAGGGSDYVEILINIDGCPCEPCQFAIGTFRDGSEVALRDQIGEHLRRYFDEYRSVHRLHTA